MVVFINIRSLNSTLLTGETTAYFLLVCSLNGILLIKAHPAGCAFIKRIPLSEHTNRKYAVVSPVRSVEFNDLMFMNTTIPIGYDGLLVSQVTTQATYIPIKLTKDVLTDVVRANRQNYSIPRIEAVTHAVSNDIFFNEPVSYGHIQKAFQVEEDLYDSFKAAATLKNFEAYL